jgi:Uma2 family endonuclease
VRNARRIIGRVEIDLTADPPPDVVVEIDVHHRSTDKMPFYASLGVLELWRYDERQLRIYVLEGGEYIEAPESAMFPDLRADLLTRLLEQSKTEGQTAALSALRELLSG